MYRHILVPTDGTLASARAERMAAQLARTCKARITALHVVDPSAPRDAAGIHHAGLEPLSAAKELERAHRRGRAALRKTATRVKRERVPFASAVVTNDAVAEAIVDAARENACDLIVMATNGRVGLERLALGSVATDVLLRSPTPVLVCR